MDHYIEIRILADPEFSSSFLMNALYNKLHRILVQLKCTDVGLSFPDYDVDKLGKRIRLHGSSKRLEEIMNTSWLRGMFDHILIGSICQVPPRVRYVNFGRKQTASNVERIRRRKMKRHNLTYEEVVQQIPDKAKEYLSLPFAVMKSQSTEQIFRLFITKLDAQDAIQGHFNAYGLSKVATVPLF